MRGVSNAQLSAPQVQVANIIGDRDATRLHVTQTNSTPKSVSTRTITLTIEQARDLASLLNEALTTLEESHAKTARRHAR